MRLELSLNNSGNKKATLDERLFGKAVRRHISCHFPFQEFKSLAILTTHNDNFSDTTIVIFRVLRHISCHFMKIGFSRINDCSY